MTPEEKSVLARIEHMTESFHQKNINAVMQNYEQGAIITFEPNKPVSDAAVLREMFKSAFTMNPQFDYSGHEVIVSGDTAVHIAPWTMTGKLQDGSSVSQSGLSVAVLRRQADGNWLIVIDNPHGQRLMAK